MQLAQSRKSRSGGWLEDEAQTRRDQQRGLEQRWLGDNSCKSGGQKGLAERTTSSKRGASLSSLECRCAHASKPRRAVKPRSGHHGNHLSNIDLQIDRPIQRAMPADTRPCLDAAGCSVLTIATSSQSLLLYSCLVHLVGRLSMALCPPTSPACLIRELINGTRLYGMT